MRIEEIKDLEEFAHKEFVNEMIDAMREPLFGHRISNGTFNRRLAKIDEKYRKTRDELRALRGYNGPRPPSPA